MRNDIIELHDALYTTKYAYYSPRYRDKIKEKSSKLLIARNFLLDTLSIKKRTWIFLTPLQQTKKVHLYGLLQQGGNVILDPRFSYEKNIETLCHEMWHVKQMYDGHLSYCYDNDGKINGIKWKGHTYKHVHIPLKQSMMGMYHDQPWEQEAFANEKILAELTLRFVNSKMKKKVDKCNVDRYIESLNRS